MGIWSRLQGIDIAWKLKEFFQYTNPELFQKSVCISYFSCVVDCIQVEKVSCWSESFSFQTQLSEQECKTLPPSLQ